MKFIPVHIKKKPKKLVSIHIHTSTKNLSKDLFIRVSNKTVKCKNAFDNFIFV